MITILLKRRNKILKRLMCSVKIKDAINKTFYAHTIRPYTKEWRQRNVLGYTINVYPHNMYMVCNKTLTNVDKFIAQERNVKWVLTFHATHQNHITLYVPRHFQTQEMSGVTFPWGLFEHVDIFAFVLFFHQSIPRQYVRGHTRETRFVVSILRLME